jgi:hypothetical protein
MGNISSALPEDTAGAAPMLNGSRPDNFMGGTLTWGMQLTCEQKFRKSGERRCVDSKPGKPYGLLQRSLEALNFNG